MKRREELEMIFCEESFEQIRTTVGAQRAETGGILLGSREDYVVKKFVFDPHGSRFSAGYDPDVDFINQVIKREWKQNELALLGFVHSHPRGVRRLSGDWGNGFGDVGYMRRIFAAIPGLKTFLVPVVYSCEDGGPFEIFPYIADRHDVENYREATLTIRKSTEPVRTIDIPVAATKDQEGIRAQHDVDGNIETYRTQDGNAYFTFRFVNVGDHFEVDILDMPSYADRSNSLHRTHRVRSSKGSYQANLRGLETKADLDLVRKLSSLWAELTWRYIRHGDRF